MTPNNLKVLVLCGGYSTRMGSPKHLLPLADGRPVYQHLLQRTSHLAADIAGFYISVRNAVQSHELEQIHENDPSFETVYDSSLRPSSEASMDIGPASGLLAAFQQDDEATWLVIACDYPAIQTTHLQTLVDNYDGRLTCFRNAEGFAEPLIGVWSPFALRYLKGNVQRGITGPNRVVKDLSARLLHLGDKNTLLNANTPEEWRKFLDVEAESNSGV